MGLGNYTPFRQEVTSSKATVFVRGLSLDDCGLLIRAHMDAITLLMQLAQDSKDAFGSVAFLIEAINRAPNFMFDVIAIACDEPDYSEAARKLPAGFQLKVLQVILDLTVEDIGGPKNLFALIQKTLGSAKSLPSEGAKALLASTGISDMG